MMTLKVPQEGGHVAVSLTGEGSLVLCVPGMGESQASFRHLVPGLTKAGFRVALMDLRGHGDSSVDFSTYDDEAAASDIEAVIAAIDGGPAIIIGNSMGAAAAVIAAARRPDLIERLVLIGPFVRDHGPGVMRLLMRVLLAKPWGPLIWGSYYRSLFGEQRPSDHDEHVDAALALLRRPGRWRAFQVTTRTSHAPAEGALAQVTHRTLVVMGDKDRDFPDPEAEARWVASALRGDHVMIAAAGHYPMAEQPDVVLAAIAEFLDSGATRG